MKKLNLRNVGFSLWLVLFGVVFGLWLCPEGRIVFFLTLLLSIFGIWTGVILLFWKRKWIRFPFLGVGLLIGLFLVLPGREPDRKRLRDNYIRRLLAYQGVTYIWGGEDSRGIDCSGLVRRGLIDVHILEGISRFNPGLVREGISLLWNDCSAQALGEGFQERTYPITTAPNINELDHSLILPGDLAVTTDGRHIMAYLGNHTWIGADPTYQPKPGLILMKVVNFKVPVKNNPWFKTPVKIVRWNVLSSLN